MLDLDASYLFCEGEFKRNINTANVDLDHQKKKLIQKESAFADSLLASTLYKLRRCQETRVCLR
jgi:hypothetical protein